MTKPLTKHKHICYNEDMSKNAQAPRVADKLPWVPKELFLDQNRETISKILGSIATDPINSAFAEGAKQAQKDVEAGGLLSYATRQFMWRHWMGAQHGTAEGVRGKVLITPENHGDYWDSIKKLSYGNLGFSEGSSTPPDAEIGHSLVLGGYPEEMAARLQAAYGDDPASGRVHNAHLLVGQRRRWAGVPNESNPDAIVSAVQRQLGKAFDMNELLSKPHWRDELKKHTNPDFEDWNEAFADEYTMGRLALEAMLYDVIDWKNEPEELPLTSADQPVQELLDAGVPMRDSAMTVYHLKNGAKATLLNAAAIPRHNGGNPRPTAESQYKELIELGVFNENPADLELPMSVSVSTPHWRTAIEAAMRIMNNDVTRQIPTIIPVGHDWLPEKEPVAALGEIPATYKADLRLRALLDGKYPDDPELLAL